MSSLQAVGLDSAQRAAGSMATLIDGPPPAPGVPDKITSTLAGMSRAQLYEIMGQMKGLIQQNPGQAKQIMVQNPQLTKALFQVRNRRIVFCFVSLRNILCWRLQPKITIWPGRLQPPLAPAPSQNPILC